jgi:hypothetical protein
MRPMSSDQGVRANSSAETGIDKSINVIKPKRKYNKQLKTVTQQLGFADPTSFSYWKSFKTLKSLKDAIKKEHPDVSNELLKTINGKNRDEKVREYLKQIG